MTQYSANISKEWGEIGFGSSKRDGYSYEVTYSVDGAKVDRGYYSLEAVAQRCKALFEAGMWDYGPHREIQMFSFDMFDIEVEDGV